MFRKQHTEKNREPQSLPEYVYDAIKEAIITGRIAPGSRLKQLEIAEEMNVSQQTVREALTSLVASGLVEQIPHRGFEVTHIPFKEQEKIYQLRAVLEIFAIEEAMQKITPEELDAMRALLPKTAASDNTIPFHQVREANRAFHMAPVRATRNRHLIRMMDQLWDITWTYFYNENNDHRRASAAKEIAEHAAIITAIENRDMPAARHIITGHLNDSLESVRLYMQETE